MNERFQEAYQAIEHANPPVNRPEVKYLQWLQADTAKQSPSRQKEQEADGFNLAFWMTAFGMLGLATGHPEVPATILGVMTGAISLKLAALRIERTVYDIQRQKSLKKVALQESRQALA